MSQRQKHRLSRDVMHIKGLKPEYEHTNAQKYTRRHVHMYTSRLHTYVRMYKHTYTHTHTHTHAQVTTTKHRCQVKYNTTNKMWKWKKNKIHSGQVFTATYATVYSSYQLTSVTPQHTGGEYESTGLLAYVCTYIRMCVFCANYYHNPGSRNATYVRQNTGENTCKTMYVHMYV